MFVASRDVPPIGMPTQITHARALDFDHIGTEISELEQSNGALLGLSEINYADSVEWEDWRDLSCRAPWMTVI